jgi:hypothetical protein
MFYNTPKLDKMLNRNRGLITDETVMLLVAGLVQMGRSFSFIEKQTSPDYDNTV